MLPHGRLLPNDAWYNTQLGTWFPLDRALMHELNKPKVQTSQRHISQAGIKTCYPLCLNQTTWTLILYQLSSPFPAFDWIFVAHDECCIAFRNSSLYILNAFFFCLRVPESFPFASCRHLSRIRHHWSLPNDSCFSILSSDPWRDWWNISISSPIICYFRKHWSHTIISSVCHCTVFDLSHEYLMCEKFSQCLVSILEVHSWWQGVAQICGRQVFIGIRTQG